MKLTPKYLRQLIIQELKMLKNFGAEKDIEDVKAKEVDADELADTLAAKKDFTCESVKRARLLKLHERILLKKLNSVKEEKKRIVNSLSKKGK